MKRITLTAILFTLIAPLVFAQTPTMPPWADPSQVRGTIILHTDVQAGLGVSVWGTVADPNNDALVTTIEAQAGAVKTIDNAAKTWAIEWWPSLTERGPRYIYIHTVEVPELDVPHGPILAADATVAIRVLPPNLPPEIKPGGCRILEKR